MQGFTFYADPVVESVQPQEGPRWGSFQMTVYLEQDVLAMPISEVCTAWFVDLKSGMPPCELGLASQAQHAALRACDHKSCSRLPEHRLVLQVRGWRQWTAGVVACLQ